MTPEREKFERVVAVAISTRKTLIENGVDEEFASEIERQISRKAGSYLPPVRGILNVGLQRSRVN